MSEKDVLLEELCNKEESLHIDEKKKSSDKEAVEAIRKKAMERMKRNASAVIRLQMVLKKVEEVGERWSNF